MAFSNGDFGLKIHSRNFLKDLDKHFLTSRLHILNSSLFPWNNVSTSTSGILFDFSFPDLSKSLSPIGMKDRVPKSTPADPHRNLTSKMSPDTQEEADTMENVPYREAVGSFLYLATTTRPDIAYAMCPLERSEEDFRLHSWNNQLWIAILLQQRPLRKLSGLNAFFRNLDKEAPHQFPYTG